MFEINKNAEVREEQFFHTKLYTIDDFYLNPDEVVEYITKPLPPLRWQCQCAECRKWKRTEQIQHYEDRRVIKDNPDLIEAYEALSGLCGQPPAYSNQRVITNQVKFIGDELNTYKTHYWWPHVDRGYNGIVYLNHDEDNGTNIYDYYHMQEYVARSSKEHLDSWREKERYILLKELKPKYNRLVLFDGLFLHAMNICNDKFFGEEYRLNQVFFFYDKEFCDPSETF